jgi:hypothetical protein
MFWIPATRDSVGLLPLLSANEINAKCGAGAALA